MINNKIIFTFFITILIIFLTFIYNNNNNRNVDENIFKFNSKGEELFINYYLNSLNWGIEDNKKVTAITKNPYLFQYAIKKNYINYIEIVLKNEINFDIKYNNFSYIFQSIESNNLNIFKLLLPYMKSSIFLDILYFNIVKDNIINKILINNNTHFLEIILNNENFKDNIKNNANEIFTYFINNNYYINFDIIKNDITFIENDSFNKLFKNDTNFDIKLFIINNLINNNINTNQFEAIIQTILKSNNKIYTNSLLNIDKNNKNYIIIKKYTKGKK